MAQWHARGLRISLAVNVSIRQLYPHGDATHFRDLVSPYVEPEWIELEVTESVLMAEPEAIEATLRQLHAHGFRLAIDDFGTGYSSLGRLRDLPIRTLKVDKSFVGGLDRHEADDRIVRAVVHLAHAMSVRPLAEGIETEEQRERLVGLGCELGQGFWFSPALPADEFAQLATQARQPA
jgi:EAL domain-containing protein (putative c-di-GMP-specific phosphodiesterase class I)